MSHNYSNYGGGPHGPPNAQDINGVESLTGSLIFPDQRIPIQQNYQQTWPNYFQETNKFEMHYQHPQPPMDNNGYFPNEQDFIPYDEGEDFYDNGESGTFRAVEQDGQVSRQSGTISTFRGMNACNPPKPPAITSRTDERPQSHNFRPVFGTLKPDPTAISDRAAELRAKLLATKRGSTPGTPASSKKPTGSAAIGHEGSKTSAEALKSSLNRHSSLDGPKALGVSGRRSSPVAPKSNEIRSSSVVQLDGSSDIEALFAEARAANAARTAGERSNQNPTDKDYTGEKLRGVSTNATVKPKPQPKTVTAKSHQPLKKTGSLSDASEVGEIRDEQSMSARVPYSEAPKAKDSGRRSRASDENPTPLTTANNISKSQVASKIDQSSGPKTRARGASPQPRDYPTTHQSPGRISDRENYQIPRAEYRRERHEQPELAQNSRYEQERDPKWQSGHWEKGDPAQNQQSSRPNAGESELVSADRRRRYEHDFQKSHENIEKNARIAAVYKKELEDKARQLDSSKVRVDNVKSATASDIEGVQERPPPISKATKAVEKPIAADHRHLNENPEDIADWLELTDYYDIQLRGQRLVLFREMKAADAHRAELQRQAEKLGIVRSQSVQPQESNVVDTSRTMTSPRNLRTSSAMAMPPPPSPLHDGQDDLGIKIRNSANRDNLSSPRKLKRLHAEDDLVAGHSQSKLQRLDPDGRSGQSRPRLSSPTLRREQTTLEERAPVEDRNSITVSRQRSRSPRARRRSMTPVGRRRDHRPSPTRFGVGETKSEQQPRESISNIREYDSNPREERDSRFLDYNPRWNSYRPNAQHYQDSPNNNYRGRGRGGRGGYHTNSRAGYKPQTHAEGGHSGEGFGSASLDLQAGSRYFMIKSWNSDNVETAQRDCIWATQPKNIAILTEAYNSCRNVILFFSINLSKAFQGYARMTSAPSEDNPAPAWSKPLIWEASPPFHIQWIVISETPFHRTGHLKNEYNEGHAVLVGKDGQEIEPGCGAALCEVIDEEAKAQAQDDAESGVEGYQGRVWHSGHEGHTGWRGYDTYRGRGGRGRGSNRRRGSDGYEEHSGGHGRFEGDGGRGGRSARDSWGNADNSGPWMGQVEGDDKMDWR